MKAPGPPLLSIVATSRNDDHGGSLLRRTQTFVNAMADQVNRYRLPTELILVEWNPPEDRPPLRDALRWPAEPGYLQVRFIQVPHVLHARYRHADALPLYQMIGKNVGIRRARGKYVLATNIDILFSNELVAFLAQGGLEPGKMYRIDRHDVMTDVPVDGSIDERLEYCQNHLLRLNARSGTYYLTPQGELSLGPKDIVQPGSGISLGSGWFPAERDGTQYFRWVQNDAAVTVIPPCQPPPPLIFEVEAGPSMATKSFDLLFVDDAGAVLTTARVRGRSIVELLLPAEAKGHFWLRTSDGDLPVRHNPRILNFRVFRCEWAAGKEKAVKSHPVEMPRLDKAAGVSAADCEVPAETANPLPCVAEEPAPISTEAYIAEPASAGEQVAIPLSSSETTSGEVAAAAGARVAKGLTKNTPPSGAGSPPALEYRSFTHSVDSASEMKHWAGVIGKTLGVLHRAAEGGPVITVWVPVPSPLRRFLRLCFKLPRQNGVAVEQRRDQASSNGQSTVCAQPAMTQEALPEANHTDGPPSVTQGVEIGPKPSNPGERLGAVAGEITTTAAENIDTNGRQRQCPEIQTADRPPGPSNGTTVSQQPPAAETQDLISDIRVDVLRLQELDASATLVSEASAQASEPLASPSPDPSVNTVKTLPSLLRPIDDPASDYYYQPAYLHTNGCGDFTLMAKEHWLELRGYPEFDMYSFHIDSVFCFAAHHAGFREVLLQDPMRIYHIEHGRGSGWTPEGETDLFARLRAKGIPWLEYSEVVTWATQMRRLESPLVFNRENWGLIDFDLPETGT